MPVRRKRNTDRGGENILECQYVRSAFKAAGVNTVWTSISRGGMQSGMDYKICFLSLSGKIHKDLHFEKIVS